MALEPRAPFRLVRGGSSAQIADYTGPAAEPVYNPETKTVHLQDGVTPGGIPLLTRALLFQLFQSLPTDRSLVAIGEAYRAGEMIAFRMD